MSLEQHRKVLFINKKRLKDLIGNGENFEMYYNLLNELVKKLLDCSVDRAVRRKLLKVEWFLLEECIKELF